MPTSVFVSYRRDDSKHAAGRLGERLGERFTLFMDVDSIRPGTDFTAVVRDAVDRADVLLALIGPTWLTAADDAGERRLDNPEDWVVAEIGTALEAGTPVVPVLVDGARMPTRQELPAALAPLASRQALTLSHERFASDCTRVIDTVEDLVRSKPRQTLPVPGGRRSFPVRTQLTAALAAVVLVGAAVTGALLLRDDPEPDGPTSGPTAQSTPSTSASPGAPPPASGTELVAAPELRPARAAGTFAMADRAGGVRIKGLEEVAQVGAGDAARTPPEGGRLVAFSLTDWACDAKPCRTPWSALDLRVRVGADSRRLPDDQGTYVVAVPAGTTAVDLVMRSGGRSQRLSLLTGEPGEDNLAVLARPDRSVDVDERFPLTETSSTPVRFCVTGDPVSSVERDVVIGRAGLHYFAGDLEPSAPDQAFLVVDASFTLDCRPGERFQVFVEELRFRGPGGVTRRARPFEGEVDGVTVRGIFEVPADLSGGTLLLGGTRVLEGYTTTLESREVPFEF